VKKSYTFIKDLEEKADRQKTLLSSVRIHCVEMAERLPVIRKECASGGIADHCLCAAFSEKLTVQGG
jgi:hypothetical protein